MSTQMFKMEFEGAEEILRDLKALAPNLGRNVMRRVTHWGAGEVRKGARKKAPKRNPMRARGNTAGAPGSLKKAIKSKRKNPGRSRFFFKSVAFISKDIAYGKSVEAGTIYQDAQHFLREGGIEESPRIIREFTAKTKREIEKEWRKLGK